jgi:hypothetical protein
MLQKDCFGRLVSLGVAAVHHVLRLVHGGSSFFRSQELVTHANKTDWLAPATVDGQVKVRSS